MKSTRSGMDLHHGVYGLGGLLLDTGIELGAGTGIGYIYGAHGDTKWGKAAPIAAAVIGKVGAAVACISGGGRPGLVCGALNSLGSAGVATIGVDLGLKLGRKAAGVQVLRLPAKDSLPANAKKVTSIGALPPASPGQSLSWEQLEELTAMH